MTVVTATAALIARYFPSPDSPLPPSEEQERERKREEERGGEKKTCYLCIPRGKPLMTTHVFAPRLKRGRGREAFSCPLLPRGAITDTSATQPLSLSFILLPSFHSLLPRQAKPFCPLSRAIWCLFSVLVCPTDVWRLAPSRPLLSSLPCRRPSALGDTRCRLV